WKRARRPDRTRRAAPCRRPRRRPAPTARPRYRGRGRVSSSPVSFRASHAPIGAWAVLARSSHGPTVAGDDDVVMQGMQNRCDARKSRGRPRARHLPPTRTDRTSVLYYPQDRAQPQGGIMHGRRNTAQRRRTESFLLVVDPLPLRLRGFAATELPMTAAAVADIAGALGARAAMLGRIAYVL